VDGRRPVARLPGTLLAASLLLQETKSPGPGARGCERQPAAGDISAAGVGGAPRREAGRIPEARGGVVLRPATAILRFDGATLRKSRCHSHGGKGKVISLLLVQIPCECKF
jgi:hypothetical protein